MTSLTAHITIPDPLRRHVIDDPGADLLDTRCDGCGLPCDQEPAGDWPDTAGIYWTHDDHPGKEFCCRACARRYAQERREPAELERGWADLA